MFLLQTLLQYCISSWEISCHISKTIDEPKKINEKSTLGIFGTKAKDIKFSLWGSFYSFLIYFPLVLRESTSQHENCKGLHASSELSHNFTSSPSPGLSGSMNFDEASEHEDDVDEERSRSLSPNADTRPASAASGQDIPVSSPTHCTRQ